MERKDEPLLKYKELPTKKLYLDGRYFNLVARKSVPSAILEPLVLRISASGIVPANSVRIPRSTGTQYVRIILEFLEGGEQLAMQSPRGRISSVVPPTPQ